MPKYKVIKLKNLTPIHVGTGKENYDFSADTLKSDTISSALASIRALRGKVDDLGDFLNSFTLSTAFPYYKNTFFLPKMHGRINIKVKGQTEYQYRKKLKSIKYIDSSIWNELVSGKEVIVDDNQIRSSMLVSNSDFENISVSEVSQRVTISRDGVDNAEPFFFEWRYYSPNAGLYCLIDCEDNVFEEIIELFNYLGDVGFGTDKSVGGGKFEVEVSELDLPIIEDATHEMTLSMFKPNYEEIKHINLENSRYDIVLRGGFMAGSNVIGLRHLRKKSVYMFNTGSVFETKNKLVGEVLDLKPDWNDINMHSVYRSGRPFSISIKMSKDG